MHDPNSPTWPYVLAFAEVMEEKLAANRHKGDREGWRKESVEWLLGRLRVEVEELAAAEPDEQVAEAADVANFCMFIADNCGALDGKGEGDA